MSKGKFDGSIQHGLSSEVFQPLPKEVDADGNVQIDVATEGVQRDFQAITIREIIGPDSFAQMGLHELILLRLGSKGETVRRLQSVLNLDVDGIFGIGTENAVRTFQKSNGLCVDGAAGPETLAKMDLFKEDD